MGFGLRVRARLRFRVRLRVRLRVRARVRVRLTVSPSLYAVCWKLVSKMLGAKLSGAEKHAAAALECGQVVER